jgi:hypothetical protein
MSMTKSDKAKEVTYDISIAKATTTSPLSDSQLAKMLSASSASLDRIETHNEDVVAKLAAGHSFTNTDTYYSFSGNITAGSVKSYGASRVYNSPCVTDKYASSPSRGHYKAGRGNVDISSVVTSNKPIKYLRTRISDFQKRLLKGTLKEGDWFPLFEWRTQSMYQGDSTAAEIKSVCLPDYVKCDKCGDRISMKGIVKHQTRPICKDKAHRKHLEDSGMIMVPRGSKIFNLGKRNAVPSELVAIDYDVYVPTWVANAVKMHEANGSPYAGMSLEEFIRKMAPNGSAEEV